MKKALLKLTILSVLTLLLGVSTALAANYVAPSQTPPNCTDGTPGCDSPIHTGLLAQVKQGLLSLAKGLDVYGLLPRVGITGEDLTVRVNGNVGADLYCDVAGENCIDPANPPGGDTFNNVINQISWPLASTTNPVVGNVTGVYFRNTDPNAGYNGGVSIGTSTNYGTKLSVFNATSDTDFNDSSWPAGIFSQVNGAGSTAIVGSVAAGAGPTYSYGSRFISPGVGVFSRGKIAIYSTTRPGGSGGTNSNDLGWFASSSITGATGLQFAGFFDGPVRVTNYKAGSAQPPVNLQVNGKVGAQEYCDEQGNNCSAAPFGTPTFSVNSWPWASTTPTSNDIYDAPAVAADSFVGIGTAAGQNPTNKLHIKGSDASQVGIDLENAMSRRWRLETVGTIAGREGNFEIWDTSAPSQVGLVIHPTTENVGGSAVPMNHVGIGTVNPTNRLTVITGAGGARISDNTNDSDSVGGAGAFIGRNSNGLEAYTFYDSASSQVASAAVNASHAGKNGVGFVGHAYNTEPGSVTYGSKSIAGTIGSYNRGIIGVYGTNRGNAPGVVPDSSWFASSTLMSQASSAGGYAGLFDGPVRATGDVCTDLAGGRCLSTIAANSGYWNANGNNISNSNSGNVGVGTANPAAKLDVNGNMWASAIATGLLSSGQVSVRNDVGSGSQGTRPAQLLIGGSNPNVKAEIGVDTILKALVIGALEENVAWKNIILANNGGNVGIGTVNPTAKLEVTGQVKITGGAPGLNKVLTSNAAGLATWQSLAGKLTTVPVPAPTDTTEPCSVGSICAVTQPTRPAGLDPRIIVLHAKSGDTGLYNVFCPTGYVMVGVRYDSQDDDHVQDIFCSPLIAP